MWKQQSRGGAEIGKAPFDMQHDIALSLSTELQPYNGTSLPSSDCFLAALFGSIVVAMMHQIELLNKFREDDFSESGDLLNNKPDLGVTYQIPRKV